MKQTVCIIRRAYYPFETHVRRNAETLATAGYSVQLICLREKSQQVFEVIEGVNVHRLPMHSRRKGLFWYLVEYLIFFILAFIEVTRLQFIHRFAVVEVDSMPDFLVFASLVPRLYGARIILYLFESMPEIWAQKTGKSMDHWMIRLIRWQERISCLFADTVICCHDLACNALVKRGIPLEKINVILNVPDERVFQQRPRNEIHPKKNELFNIIQHGTITDNYGIQVVIKALKLINPDIPIKYNVVGRGEYRPKLEEMVCELGLQSRVTFHGYVSREHLLELLSSANIGIVPMLFEYQSPNKLFDFIASGIPVIASDRNTFKQHFADNEILYFATGDPGDLAEKIVYAIHNPELLSQQAQCARTHYQKFRWGVMKERYLKLYA
jgi:glycosyltransferase involved in cell wall biosynthesis